MKRFITAAIGLSVFFTGLGAIVEKAAAGFRSDEKALEIIRKARTAIGGDAAISGIGSLVIKGKTTNTFTVDGSERVEQGETEIALQLPDRMSRIVKIGKGRGTSPDGAVRKSFDVIVDNDGTEPLPSGATKIIVRKPAGEAGERESGETKIFVRKADGTPGEIITDGDTGEFKSADGRKFTIVRKESSELRDESGNVVMERRMAPGDAAPRHDELLRTTLALLVSAPEGRDISYAYAGDSSLDGTAVSAVVASFGGSSFKLFFDRSSGLPVAMSYVGHPGPVIVKMRREGAEAAPKGDVVKFVRKADGPAEGVETMVRFSDHRSVNGVLLPHKWTTATGGKVTEVLDVTAFEINPANIADRFEGQRVEVRMNAKDQN